MIPSDELENLKLHLDPVSVLQWIGYEKSKPRRSGGEVRDYCPIHRGDSQQSLAIKEATGEFLCHSCGEKGGDLIQLYAKAKGFQPKDFPSLIEELQRLTGTPFFNDHSKKQKELQKNHEEELVASRNIAKRIWENATEVGDASYFEAKGIETPDGIRYGRDQQGNVCSIVPYYDMKGGLQTVQYIRKGTKLFATGSKTSGSFFSLGWNFDKNLTVVYLSEGMATACSVFEALKRAVPVLSCGSASNISKVVKAVSDEHPGVKIIVCLDDDHTVEKILKEVKDLNIPGVLFKKPDFSGIDRRIDEKGKVLDKDFDDLRQRAGLKKVVEQLDEGFLSTEDFDRDAVLASGLVGIQFIEDYFQKLPPGIDIGLKTGNGIHDKILLPSGGYTVFCGPTKHGKTAALVNVVEHHLSKDQEAKAIFISLEEFEPPILLRFINRFLNEEFSKSNFNTLSNFFRSNHDPFSMFSNEWKKRDLEGGDPKMLFQNNLSFFEERYLKNGRLRILSFNSDEGAISQIEVLCRKIEEFKKWIPGLRIVAIDYLQLLCMQKPMNRSRDEVLKEVCLQLKDLAASTGLMIVTAAQFNRTIQHEDDLHPSAIGEAGSIERHAALVIGMWNRQFKQISNGKVDSKKKVINEIVLSIMLNRHGSAGQKLIAPYNGNIGSIDFEEAIPEIERAEIDKKENKTASQSGKNKFVGNNLG